MHDILHNLSVIHQRIQRACEKAGRNTDEVQLLLATKTVTAENIKIALQAGKYVIGENKVQELKDKYAALSSENCPLHFIGHLQTNKVKEVLKYASCIQSVDRIDLVEKLDQRLQQEGRSMDILVQVNTSYENSKFGVIPENTIDFVKSVTRYDTLRIKGLMTIGLFTAEPEKIRKCFRLLKELQQHLTDLDLHNVSLQTLSMGMSGDMETAIEEGSTMIRVGTAVFGPRQLPDSHYWKEI